MFSTVSSRTGIPATVCGTHKGRARLDLVLLGQIMALLSNDTETGARSKKAPTTRQRSAMLFHHGGWRICSKTFQKLHGIGTIAIINTCTCEGNERQ